METIQRTRSPTWPDSVGCGEKQRKKSSKWSIGGFFRRSKKKINNTDSSTSSEDADKSYLKRPRSVRKGRSKSRKDFTENGRLRYPLGRASDIVRFEHRICADNAELECPPVSSFNETLPKTQHRLGNYRDNLLKDRHECKRLIEKSINDRLMVESSSDDGDESSEQRKNSKCGLRDGSLSSRSRASRTERYRKRVLGHDKLSKPKEDHYTSQSSKTSAPLTIPSETRLNDKAISNNQWTADIVYCESSDYETKYTAKMKSASSSPMQSPKVKHKYALCHSSSPTQSLNFVSAHSRLGVAASSSDLSYSYCKPVNAIKQNQSCINTIPPKLPKSNSNISLRQPSSSRPIVKKNESNQNNIKIYSSLSEKKLQTPPLPPPRDPHRKVIFGYNNKANPYSNLNNPVNHIQQLNSGYLEFGSTDSAFRRFHHTPEYKQNLASNSMSHLRNYNDSISIERDDESTNPLTYGRPVFASPECTEINECKNVSINTESESVLTQDPNQYNFLTDKPRCRKPIQTAYKPNQSPNEQYLSDSHLGPSKNNYRVAQSSGFTRSDELLSCKDLWFLKDQSNSDKICLSDDCSNKNQSNLPDTTGLNIESYPLSFGKDISNLSDSERVTPISDLNITPGSVIPKNERDHESIFHQVSPHSFKSNISPIESPIQLVDSKLYAQSELENCDEKHDENTQQNKKNRNSLEDALNELEAIYQSLKLDDDKYYENDGSSQIENNKYISDDSNSEMQSDLNLIVRKSKSPCPDNTVSPNKRSNSRRPETPNPVTDDMAYRRLIKKEKLPSHEKEIISQAGSFLLVSPTLSPPPFFEIASPLQYCKEPDITYDDVVYRNIQHTNNALKILDPQPPFGIPLLPVTQSPNSSYLCVNSKESFRPTFKPKKYPDIVADDLAYRNLRKDNHKDQLSKSKVDQQQSNISVLGSASFNKKKTNMKIGCKGDIAPLNSRLSYNNNIEEDLNELKSFNMMTDSSKVSGFVPEVQYAQPVVLENNLKTNDRYHRENSQTVRQISESNVTEISWPLSSKTITESKISGFTEDSMQANRDEHRISIRDTSKYESPLSLNNVDRKCPFTKHPCGNLQNSNDNVVQSKAPANDFEGHDSDGINCINESSNLHFQFNTHYSQTPGCEIVKLDELTITENENSGMKQSANEDSSGLVDGERNFGINTSSDSCLGGRAEKCENDHCPMEKFSLTQNSYKARLSLSSMYDNDLTDSHEFVTEIGNSDPFSENTATGPGRIAHSSPEDNEFMKVSYLPVNDNLEEDQDQGPSRKTLCAVISDEGTKESCVAACNQRTFLICMVWLHQLVSLDTVAVLSITLAVAALLLIVIL